LIMIAPVPANTSANVPINSAPHFFMETMDRVPFVYPFALYAATRK